MQGIEDDELPEGLMCDVHLGSWKFRPVRWFVRLNAILCKGFGEGDIDDIDYTSMLQLIIKALKS